MRLVLLLLLAMAAPPALAAVTEDLASGKIPLYPGAKPLPAKVPDRSRGLYTVDASVERVVAFYRTELPKRGWHPDSANGLLGAHLDQVPLALLRFDRKGSRLRVVAAAKRYGTTTLWITTR